jgi:glycogen debranching enzyme
MSIESPPRAATIERKRTLRPYELLDSELPMGMSLGNSALFVITRNNGVIERVFSTALGMSPLGSIAVLFAFCGHAAEDTTGQYAKEPFVVLRPDGLTRRMELHPAYQRSRYSIAGSIAVTETAFVPLNDLSRNESDPPFVYQTFELVNTGERTHFMRATVFARLSGAMSADVRARYDKGAQALVIRDRVRSRVTRFVGMSAPAVRFETTSDFGRAYNPRQDALKNSTQEEGDILGLLQCDFALEPGQRQTFSVNTAIYVDEAESDALSVYKSAPSADEALGHTLAYAGVNFNTTEVLTPDPVINAGVLWAKVNMRRVMAKYPFGYSFTNDPATYSNIVLRDVAWFVHGCDYYMPWFSRAALQKFADLQYPDGRLPEYYNAVTGQAEDFGLNINDDTPLFIVAVSHHFRATADREWLQSIYPNVARAARYIMKQIDDRGLVFCSAKDPRGNLWAIASWRNIIPNYALNGAVTEINAECSHALRQTAELARLLGDSDAEADRFAQGAEDIRSAMDRHLIDPETGLYYLNIDVNGDIHSDVTGDEVFPVIFNVCSEETARRIIRRLLISDFWTAGGLRTASYGDPRYDPSAYAGLIGGVWPGLTWWFAFAAARAQHPEFVVRALRASFEHYAANPRVYNTVPGQFSEWFDGETLSNRGMRLSPWEPPRFLWAAIEGVCGLNLSSAATRINPLVPSDWSWVGLRRLNYHGGELSYFAIREEGGAFDVYSTAPIETAGSLHIVENDVTDHVSVFSASSQVAPIALRGNDGSLVVLLGSTSRMGTTVPFDMGNCVDENATYSVRTYSSDERVWSEPEQKSGRDLRSLAPHIEPCGFQLLSVEPTLSDPKKQFLSS